MNTPVEDPWKSSGKQFFQIGMPEGKFWGLKKQGKEGQFLFQLERRKPQSMSLPSQWENLG